jgi:hypothetical protein
MLPDYTRYVFDSQMLMMMLLTLFIDRPKSVFLKINFRRIVRQVQI